MSESYFLRTERLGLVYWKRRTRRNALHGSMIPRSINITRTTVFRSLLRVRKRISGA